MTQINAYVGFNGKCSEAMTFYKECLGGDLFKQTVGESPMKDQCPAGSENDILHSSLTRNNIVMLMGTDMTGPEGYNKGNNIALSLNCSSEEEINTFFSNLSQGGKIIDDLKTQFWGAVFGVVKDKFDITWMFNYDKSQDNK